MQWKKHWNSLLINKAFSSSQNKMKKLFIAGDSISIQYGEFLLELAKHNFLCSRKWIGEWRYNDPWIMEGMNGWSSSQLLAYFKEKATLWFLTDILLFNAWLHDIKRNKITGHIQVSLIDYEKNLIEMIATTKKIATIQVRVTTIWHDEKHHNSINTLSDRFENDNLEYHLKAVEIMEKNGISIIDLRSFTQAIPGNIWSDRVHFTKRVCYKQAVYILNNLISKNYHL